MNEWLKDLKIGDDIFQIESHGLMPTGRWNWKAKVTDIYKFRDEVVCVETLCERDHTLEWLLELTKKLAPNHRAYNKVWTKNYVAPDGTINLEKY